MKNRDLDIKRLNLALLFTLWFLSMMGCVSAPRTNLPTPSVYENDSITIGNPSRVSVDLLSIEAKKKFYQVRLRFYNISSWPYLVQHIDLRDGEHRLIECFRFEKIRQHCVDRHRMWGAEYDKRVMHVYAAYVEGVDLRDRIFGHLPSNLEGNLKTDLPYNFNRSYRDNHKTQGRVVKVNYKLFFRWSILFDNEKIIVKLPNKTYIKWINEEK